MKRQGGFTIVELLLVILVVGILATVTIAGYGMWQKNISYSKVQSEVQQAASSLENYNNFNNTYSPNFAGTGYSPANDVVISLKTNTPSLGKFGSLTKDQNTRLFLNTCNGKFKSVPSKPLCSIVTQGSKGIQILSTDGTSSFWTSPIAQSSMVVSCSTNQTACNTAISSTKSQFLSQGGTFPVTVSSLPTPLPVPTVTPYGRATAYCIDGQSASFPDVAYHIDNTSDSVSSGPCPNDPNLHYP